MRPPASRLRRYLLIFGFLGIAAGLVGGWFVFRQRFPNLFDREHVDAAEVNKLAAVDLSQSRERNSESKDWPQFRGPLRDGWSPGTDFRTNWNDAPPTVQWSKPGGGGYSSIAVVEGKLYTMDRDGTNERIRCLNAADGADLWSHEYPADYGTLKMGYAAGPRATPTIHKNMLYAVGATGQLTALKLPATPGEKPTVAWQRDLIAEYDAPMPTWGAACSPLVEGDLVVVQPGGKRGSVVAFDRTTGEPRWTCGTDPRALSVSILR